PQSQAREGAVKITQLNACHRFRRPSARTIFLQ
ncbi:MAG: hypothetical protein ACI8RN_001303, partial [Glaciecola sp.]